MGYKTIFFLCLFWNNLSFAVEAGFLFVPFKQSMNVVNNHNSKTFQKFENIYQTRNPNVFRSAGWSMIPKKIHHIWLYDTPIPSELLRNVSLWKEMLPDWEYKLWLLEDINNLAFSTKDLYRKSKKISEKLDIVKFEILNKFGGVYLDIDYIPLQNIAYLNNYYKFYAGLDPWNDNASNPEISVTFLASIQNNLLLHKTLEVMRDEWHRHKYYKNFTKDVFNKVIRDNIDSYKRSIVFPASYFGVVLLDHTLINFISKGILFKEPEFFNQVHKETIAVKQKY